uniref:Thioredoxin family protein n=1 Tax=Roseihalotalea indica TaxID=2867963 RepID=A0AA49GS78_9BACT|nr:thioredoxin family protein [Tunicatimonas sp. TK19036]
MLKITSAIGFILLSMFSPILSQSSDQIQNFTLPNAVDGKVFSLSEYRDAKAVVIIFTSLYCPYAKLYEGRIMGLIDQYKNKSVRFILINPNNPEKSKVEAIPNMAAEAKRSQLDIPFLSDSAQEVASLLGASKTPEAFILQPHNGVFTVAYHGAIDDNPQVEDDVKHHYLQDALKSVTSNHPIATASSSVTGCMIKR